MSATLDRREFLKAMGAAAGALALPDHSKVLPAPSQRPNILYIMADDCATTALSCYGSRLAPVFKTPNIDSIAQQGVRLTRCFCVNSICVPSRANILTGQHSNKNGCLTLDYQIDPARQTFVKMLQQSGYTTAVFGKWHLGTEPQGFDEYKVVEGQGAYFDPKFLEKSQTWKKRPLVERKGYFTDIVTDLSIEWLDKRDNTKPFMLMCHHKAPHGPWRFHPRHAQLLENVEIPEPPSLLEDKSHRSAGSRDFGKGILKDKPNATPDERRAAYQAYMKNYLRCVAAVDENVGRLLDYLKKENLVNNTIVVFTSDQGMFLGEHNYEDKRWMFEEALQMPFVMRLPGEIEPSRTNDDIITNVDFAPTFLDYARRKPDPEMQGRSFRSNLVGKTPADWPTSLYYRYWMHLAHLDVPAHFGVRTKTHKLIFFYGMPLDARGALPRQTPPGWELYDLEKDPQELKNVYQDPAYAETVRQLKAELFRLKKLYGDTDEKYPELLKLEPMTDQELETYGKSGAVFKENDSR
jgi:arylsulfatase A-like enzyme